MGKVSLDDKMRILTLREQGLGYRAISTKYPQKNWKLDTVKLICNASMKQDQISPENQAKINPGQFVRRR